MESEEGDGVSGEGLVWVDEDGNKMQITKSHSDLLKEVRFGNYLKQVLIALISIAIITMGFVIFTGVPGTLARNALCGG